MKEHKASSEMKLFFEKLLDLKEYCAAHCETSKDVVLHEIYKRLNEIIKEGKKQ